MSVLAGDFCDLLMQRIGEVTDEEVAALQAGRPCPSGGTRTGIHLLNEEKVTLVIFFKYKEEYLLARSQFERLKPHDPKVAPLAELSLRYNECRFILDLFWVDVRSRLTNHATYFREIGFDQNFEFWYGPSIRRDLGDFSSSFDESSIRL